MEHTLLKGLDPTPPRPDRPIGPPPSTVRLHVDVETAHLANSLVATSRLLASEAGAAALVTGDDQGFDVIVAVPDATSDADQVEAWVRWAVHNAGVRGRVRRTAPPDPT